ncbi:DNA polymerase [Tardiphaga sp. 367_B4_N1_1]|uniref:DNA polymerase n=1 Tax=Tardiphaga sp. 367_B4_N1_1 TaxID=3240777 RepID=UPI003F27E7F4
MALRLLFDTESNGFVANATKIHCSGRINVETGEKAGYRPHQIKEAVEELDSADELIGHNIIRHDIPLLTKLTRWKPRRGVIIRDTMVMARLKYPGVKSSDDELIRQGKMPPGKKYKGKHTIGAWGYRLGNPKGDYADLMEAKARAAGLEHPKDIANFVWGEFSEEMFDYMMQDCESNLSLWKHINPDEYSQDAIELEHRVSVVVNSMEEHGVPFDLRAAGELQANLTQRQHELEKSLKEHYGFWYAPVSPDPTKSIFIPKKPNKPATAELGDDGNWHWSNPGYWGELGDTPELVMQKNGKPKMVLPFKGYPCTKLKKVSFNPGSRDHIAKVLIERGWEPSKFTEGGKPQIDEEVIESIVARYPEMDGLGDLMMIEKRLSQLCGTDNSLMASVKEDGCIHGVINPMGTITSRGAHMFPNLGQVPSAKKPYGPEFRALFMCGSAMPKGWVALGADQEGLELRGLAHYLAKFDGGEYAKTVLEGDPHWLHAVVMGLAEGERDKHNKLHTIVREDGSKRFIYAYIYGCGDEKAGSIIYEALLNALRNGGPEGVEVYTKFFGDPKSPPRNATIKAVGKKVRNAFLTRIKGFDRLRKQLTEQVSRRNRVPGLDGRRIPVRSEHSALNFLIQSAGAIICKRWLADSFEECCSKFKLGWDGDFVFVLWVHDEIQVCCRKEVADEIGEILVRNARIAGEPYGFRVPLDSKAVQGLSWKDTH